jgi:thymidylate synthase
MKFYREDHAYDTTSAAYLGTLEDVYLNPTYKVAPRGLPIREKLDYMFHVANPTSEPIRTHDFERNVVIADYTAKELALYDSGTNRVEDFAKASKFWEKLANDAGEINSAYGHLIWYKKSCGNGTMTPWDWAKQSLIQDKDTRQAILRFSLPEHQIIGVKDFPCTIYCNFLIREDRLNLTTVMRSQDLVKGTPYDVSWFCSLMDRMIGELKTVYPDLIKGSYTHFMNSCHLYEQNLAMVEKMLGLVIKEK